MLQVLVAAVLSMFTGFLWYSPWLFGQQWAQLMGFTAQTLKQAQAKMGPMYGLSFLGALVTSTVLRHFILANQDLTLAFLFWLGFVLPVQLTDQIFNTKPFNAKLLAINTSYQLASLIVMTILHLSWH